VTSAQPLNQRLGNVGTEEHNPEPIFHTSSSSILTHQVKPIYAAVGSDKSSPVHGERTEWLFASTRCPRHASVELLSVHLLPGSPPIKKKERKQQASSTVKTQCVMELSDSVSNCAKRGSSFRFLFALPEPVQQSTVHISNEARVNSAPSGNAS
jgi:hypothetical protein